MQLEPFAAFQQSLRRGPDYCPPELFEGSVPHIVRGLKVHANNIAHARHVALEETYPRLLHAMGPQAFHAAAERFLNQSQVLCRALDALGEGFEQLLDDAALRDLARAEWLWLEAFQSAEDESLTLAELASLDPDTLLEAHLRLHPAARWLALEEPETFAWNASIVGHGDVLLFSRPDAEVLIRRVGDEAAFFLPLLSKACPVPRLLGAGLPALIALIDAGAIIMETRHEG